MKACRNVIFLLLLLFVDVWGASTDFESSEENNEGSLQDGLADELLARLGVSPNFSIHGDLHFTSMFIKQRKGDNDGAVASLQGDVIAVYSWITNGHRYGIETALKLDSKNVRGNGTIWRSLYSFWESDIIGMLKFGWTNTAADKYCVDGANVLVGYYGAGSRNLPCLLEESAGSYIENSFTYDDSRALKVAWLSPVISGFSYGISFTPNSRDAGPAKTKYLEKLGDGHEKLDFSHTKGAYSENIVTGGVAYEFGDPNGLNVRIAIATWYGKGKSVNGIKLHDVKAYNIGAMICHSDTELSLGYTNNTKSLLAKEWATHEGEAFNENRKYKITDPDVGLMPGANAGEVYSIGLAHRFCKNWKASAGYFMSEVKFSKYEKSKADMIALAIEYEPQKNIKLYLEYDYVSTKACNRAQTYAAACGLPTIGKNEANMAMIGVKLNF
ncbi:MAG: porin [Holosporaceae bacterium]|jgi:predicted porin|nr:porin [Holosporaceae bacterium]